MSAINLADAKAHLSELIDRVEAGIRRHHPARQAGRAAHGRGPPRKRIDAALLQSLTATMPPQAEAAADLVRSMRDGDRY